MRQTYALLVDAYRELNAKKLFWITLALSGLIVIAIAAIGLNPTGLSIFGWTPGFLSAEGGAGQVTDEELAEARSTFYKAAFDWVGIKFWLTWAAIALAIFSTAGMFPDLIREGAIDLLLSKPIGRFRLFITKYLLGLGFVGLQVAVFSVCAFVVIGLRAGDWDPRMFLAIPIVLMFFSYLFAVCVLVGVLTRSTLLAVIATGVVWLVMFGVNLTDAQILGKQAQAVVSAEVAEARIAFMDTLPQRVDRPEDPAGAGDAAAPLDTNADADAPDEMPTFDPSMWALPETRAEYALIWGDEVQLRQQAEFFEREAETYEKWRGYLYLVKTPLPKTGETRQLMSRALKDREDLDAIVFDPLQPREEFYFPMVGNQSQLVSKKEFELEAQQRSWAWILLTSLLFEAAVVGLAAWLFCRRDY